MSKDLSKIVSTSIDVENNSAYESTYASEGEILIINDAYLIKHDKTGKTAYTPEEKAKIITNFLDNQIEHMFISKIENGTKIKGTLKDSVPFVVPMDKSEFIRLNMLNAIVYIGYTDGNFKNCNYLLCGEIRKPSGISYLYTKIIFDEISEHGRLFSSLSEEIHRFGENHREIDSNLYKMMKRNKYELVNENQKSYLFGKGHMAEKTHKVTVKKDLDRLFTFMQISKNEILNDNFEPVEFDVNTLRYFKFRRVL